MEKNVIVWDESDVQIGYTYPKRAKGLVKSGRAVYVDGDELAQPLKIRLLTTPVPTKMRQEEHKVCHIINFNAREFQFDETCTGREGQRIWITDFLGNHTEAFEIGGDASARTQIKRDVVLEPDTDYVFRFAMTGGANRADDVALMFSIVPRRAAAEPTEELSRTDWDARTNYALAQSRFQPVCSKDSPDGLLRVYEIPFQTDDCTVFRFVFAAMHQTAAFMPAYELKQYASLPDISAAAWQERQTASEPKPSPVEKPEKTGVDLSGAVLTMDAYNKAMEFASKGIPIDFSGAVIGQN